MFGDTHAHTHTHTHIVEQNITGRLAEGDV
jgi:hypothetical protein